MMDATDWDTAGIETLDGADLAALIDAAECAVLECQGGVAKETIIRWELAIAAAKKMSMFHKGKKMMQRYRPHIHIVNTVDGRSVIEPDMTDDSNGSFVRYEEAVAEIERLKAMSSESLQAAVRELHFMNVAKADRITELVEEIAKLRAGTMVEIEKRADVAMGVVHKPTIPVG